jgi:hypothetical protein
MLKTRAADVRGQSVKMSNHSRHTMSLMKTTLLILALFGALTACETSKTTYRIAGQNADLTY